MNNISIIIEAALMEGIWTPEQVEEYITAGEGLPLKTFAEWKKAGYVVKKGESAVLKTRLWQMKKKKKSADEQTDGEDKDKNDFYLCPAHLFSAEQVVPMEKKEDEKID